MATQIPVRGRKARKEPDVPVYNEMSMRHNVSIIDYCRTSVSALSGATAGIMGLTGLYGFVFYFVSALMLSLMLMVKAGSQWQKHFRSRTVFLMGGLLGSLFTYILFWTFLYGMVHVY